MDRQSQDRPLLALLGPTASGKTELALELAVRGGFELASLDSMLVYRGLDVGTAKPTTAERERVPHHLIDLIEPCESYDARRYLADADAVEKDVATRGHELLFVGGTAFYLRLLTHGLFKGPAHDPEVRARIEQRAERIGLEALHLELAAVDAASAERIHANDRKRVVRALEVFEQTGRKLSDWQREWRDSQGGETNGRARRLVGLMPPRDVHEAGMRARVERMLAAGWCEEVARIRDGQGFSATSIQALGYRHVLAHLEGELSRDELVERVTLETRQFARRQRTWFRRYPEIRWAPEEWVAEALGGAERGAEARRRLVEFATQALGPQ